MKAVSLYEKESFKGETSHPRWLKRSGFLAIILSIVIIVLGVTNTMLAAMRMEPMTSLSYYPINFAYVAAGIWTPLTAFLTGLFAVGAGGLKFRLALTSLLACTIFLPILIAISSVEIRQLLVMASYVREFFPNLLNLKLRIYKDLTKTPQRYAIVVSILAIAVVLFLVCLSIMVIVFFCTLATDEDELNLTQETSNPSDSQDVSVLPITSHTLSPFAYTPFPTPPKLMARAAPSNYAVTPTTQTDYKVVQLVPNSYPATPVSPNYMVSNMPLAYQNAAGLKVYMQ
ncbi:hypothetical protein HELRODRAFT_163497 [Helobdella robusta]|uniref:Uncharacterized protein n=1 Tax=Helobdella robusta TaxID=6412 RepID=T1EU48_HELRO|nr:hypothetical protein HELRODRAFT_163497 [Helobdella robusta]ESN96436.1 hypothetical protein HELRODRAFT_163497 [Helobdella robusta]